MCVNEDIHNGDFTVMSLLGVRKAKAKIAMNKLYSSINYSVTVVLNLGIIIISCNFLF